MNELTESPSTQQLAVLRQSRAFRLVSTEPLAPGDVVLTIEGRETRTPTRYSVQVGRGLHVDLPTHVEPFDSLDSHQWRFLNHSCAPNARFLGRDLIATKTIPAWTEITFDYDTTEWNMATPFECRCGAPNCRRTIRGYRWLSPEAKATLAGRVLPHLLELDS